MLYERDYTKLTDQEKADIQKAVKPLGKNGGLTSIDYRLYPKAGFFNKSYFPNNMLDIDELRVNERTTQIIKDYKSLIDNRETTERDIQRFIKEQRAYFIIASVLSDYHFGHHSAYAFPEFELPPNYKVDYLIIGKSSYGHEFIFIELENPYENITTKDGNLGTTFRKGLKQVNDWENWIESNYSHLELVFQRYRANTTNELPREFRKLDTTRIHYVVVAGRRSDFNEETYRLARKMNKDRVEIMHYDNIKDKAEQILSSKNYV